MDKQTYLKKFSRIVRWKLPKSEADAVLADYNEMFSEYSGGNKEIPIQEFGKPAQAAQFLFEPNSFFCEENSTIIPRYGCTYF